jgi:hypothetical protein
LAVMLVVIVVAAASLALTCPVISAFQSMLEDVDVPVVVMLLDEVLLVVVAADVALLTEVMMEAPFQTAMGRQDTPAHLSDSA